MLFRPSFDNKRSAGVILILAALFLLVFISLCALGLGLGFAAYQRSNFRRAANASALAAIERFSQLRDAFRAGQSDAAQNVENRAWEFLGKNLPGGQQSTGDLTQRFNLDITYGKFITREPAANVGVGCSDSCTNCVCTNGYPCFLSCPGTAKANANAIQVKVSTKTGAENEILVPLGFIFGKETFALSSSAVGMIVPRCTAFLMDVSLSVAQETHDPSSLAAVRSYTDNINPDHSYSINALITSPEYNGLFAYRAGNVQTQTFDTATPGAGNWTCRVYSPRGVSDGSSGDSSLPALNERIRWCSLRRTRGDTTIPPWNLYGTGFLPANPDPLAVDPWKSSPPDLSSYPASSSNYYTKTHYLDDYEAHFTKVGWYLFDSYVDNYYSGPEPLNTFLHAFHSALVTLKGQQTNQDLVEAKAFTGQIRDEVPCHGSTGVDCSYRYTGPKPALTNDLDYLIQITNIQNRGTFTRVNGLKSEASPATPLVEPNFLTHGWFPYSGGGALEGGTNIVHALREAIDDLIDPDNCPADYKKLIILATDGKSTCFSNNDGTSSCGSSADTDYTNYYLPAETQLISSWEGGPYGTKSILEKLKESEISLTVMLAGDYIEPNFCNIQRDQRPPEFLDILEAAQLGYSWNPDQETGASPCSKTTKNFFVSTPVGGDDIYAYNNAGRPGVKFRRPNGVLGKMAMETGGLWCPLQDRDSPLSRYAEGIGGPLGDGYRLANEAQTKSVLNFTKPQMAASCASRAVGYNPFALVEPKYVGAAGS
jgi:hypothetical protein